MKLFRLGIYAAWILGNAWVHGEAHGQTAPDVKSGRTVTGAPGPAAKVTSTKTRNTVVLNFKIPQGLPGATGVKGPAGQNGAHGVAGPAGKNGTQGPAGENGLSYSPKQVALLKWWVSSINNVFSTGSSPSGVCFDGANIWVANSQSNTVKKL